MTKVTLKDIKDLQFEINESLAATKAIREEIALNDYSEWKRRYDDSWRKDSRLSMKLTKLKRKYWEEHGIQD